MARHEVKRRTFEAAKFPKGSPERARLNENALTSEYTPSHRYAVIVTPTTSITYRTKAEALAAVEARERNMRARREPIAVANDALVFLEEDGDIQYDIGSRGGYVKARAADVCRTLGLVESVADNLPPFVGAGCNYLGGGLRGAIFFEKKENFIRHGVMERDAILLEAFGEACRDFYLAKERQLFGDGTEEGNWDGAGTNAARAAGVTRAY